MKLASFFSLFPNPFRGDYILPNELALKSQRIFYNQYAKNGINHHLILGRLMM